MSNHLILFTIKAGEKPFGGPTLTSSFTDQAIAKNFPSAEDSTSNLNNYFIMPTTGWNWGRLHDYNAVDIASNCGTPIYATAKGLVIESVFGGWNDGYGNYIKIDHPNGSQTLYGHTSKNIVSTGKYVYQGDLIGYMGNTGNTHGPTGCHLHFEVRDAKNPLAK